MSNFPRCSHGRRATQLYTTIAVAACIAMIGCGTKKSDTRRQSDATDRSDARVQIKYRDRVRHGAMPSRSRTHSEPLVDFCPSEQGGDEAVAKRSRGRLSTTDDCYM